VSALPIYLGKQLAQKIFILFCFCLVLGHSDTALYNPDQKLFILILQWLHTNIIGFKTLQSIKKECKYSPRKKKHVNTK
jgi:hypothetical protein